MNTQFIASAQQRPGLVRFSTEFYRHCQDGIRRFQLKMANRAFGRVALHIFLGFKTGHYAWHWRGVWRELASWRRVDSQPVRE